MLNGQALEAALLCAHAQEKCARVADLQPANHWRWKDAAQDFLEAGRPSKPALVPPSALNARKSHDQEGLAALIHAVCHIEFNAINLALDAAYRFRHLPAAFTNDWLSVAQDEARHFQLLLGCLKAYGHAYGDFAAHNQLWDMAWKTAYDPLVRMALVPRVLEARGLDVTPGIRQKFAQQGDLAACAALDVIYEEEVRHVTVGNFWFAHLCAARALEPMQVFRALLARYDVRIFRGFVNESARQKAGFSTMEMALLRDFETQRTRRNWRGALSQGAQEGA